MRMCVWLQFSAGHPDEHCCVPEARCCSGVWLRVSCVCLVCVYVRVGWCKLFMCGWVGVNAHGPFLTTDATLPPGVQTTYNCQLTIAMSCKSASNFPREEDPRPRHVAAGDGDRGEEGELWAAHPLRVLVSRPLDTFAGNATLLRSRNDYVRAVQGAIVIGFGNAGSRACSNSLCGAVGSNRCTKSAPARGYDGQTAQRGIVMSAQLYCGDPQQSAAPVLHELAPRCKEEGKGEGEAGRSKHGTSGAGASVRSNSLKPGGSDPRVTGSGSSCGGEQQACWRWVDGVTRRRGGWKTENRARDKCQTGEDCGG